MKRQELAHILRAACGIADDGDILVIGSQAILGTYDEDDLPPRATASMEADIAFFDDPDRRKADEVDGGIGEWSPFHETNGVYAEGVAIETATFLPAGRRDRLVGWPLRSSEPATPRFLDPHGRAIAKLGAGRGKDLDFVAALIGNGLLELSVLRRRADLLPDEHAEVRGRIATLLASYARSTP